MHEMKRAYQKRLFSYLRMFPCIALIGVRQCGKTTLLRTLPAPWKRYDLERRADFQIVSRDPDLFFRQMGASWERMVVEEILRQIEAQGVAHECSHYRTGAGAEVDLILEGDFGLVAFEIKHTSTVNPRGLRSLRDFVRETKRS
jgi:predicted AAA+ superfamily ATPase